MNTTLIQPISLADQKKAFENLCESLFSHLTHDESLALELKGEQSLFVRYNNSKIRQIGEIQDFNVTFSYFSNNRYLQRNQSLMTCTDVELILKEIRKEASSLPLDPYAKAPVTTEHSTKTLDHPTALFPNDLNAINSCLKNVQLTGILACGPIVRATANSSGAKHWFETERTTFDYSLTTPDNRMVTACYSDTHWNEDRFKKHVASSFSKQKILEKPAIEVKPGSYRVYLAPQAMEPIFSLMNYSAFGLAKFKQGQSPLTKLVNGEKKFSPALTLTEDFQNGFVPKFNANGELAQNRMDLIKEGQHAHHIVSTRSAQEYGVKDTAANAEETPRSLSIQGGKLNDENVYESLDTGLYLSNLHYLNWSDVMSARITGMTRFACVWVEKGKPVGPLKKDMRFDVSLYDIFNTQLLGLTKNVEFIPDILTYYGRECGGLTTPGALIDGFIFTL